MTNLTKEEYARLHLKAKRGMLTAEERAALEAYEAAAQPAPQTPVPADTETLLCCPYCGHATITTQIVSDVTYRKPATVIAMMFAPLIAVVLAFLLRNMFVTVLALIVVIVSALVPMWAFYRGNYSVTHMLLQQAMEEQRRREREAAERRLYESRRNMWDAEKRLKSAEKALAHEDEREVKAHVKTTQERYARARSVSPSTPRSADKDKQFGE